MYRYTTHADRFKYMYRIWYVNPEKKGDTAYYYFDGNGLDMKHLPTFELGESDAEKRARRILGPKFRLSDTLCVGTCQSFRPRFYLEYLDNDVPVPQGMVEVGRVVTTITSETIGTSQDLRSGTLYDQSGREIHQMPNDESKVWNGTNWTCPDCP